MICYGQTRPKILVARNTMTCFLSTPLGDVRTDTRKHYASVVCISVILLLLTILRYQAVVNFLNENLLLSVIRAHEAQDAGLDI